MIRFYTIHHCRYCLQSLAIKYTRKDTAFRTELSQGLSAISCVYYKTYTSFKGAKIQIYFYNKKLFSSFLSQGRFGMGAKYNVRDLRKKGTQQHWANCNGGNLQYGRIASHTPLRQLADFAPTTCAKEPIPCP